MKILLCFLVCCIIVSSYIISINFKVNKNDYENETISYENTQTNLSEIVWFWSTIAMISLFTVIASILVIINHRFVDISFINTSLLQKALVIFFGILSTVSCIIAWEYFGRNNLTNNNFLIKKFIIFITFANVVILMYSFDKKFDKFKFQYFNFL